MAITACAGEVLDQLDLLVGEWSNLLAVDADYADQFVFLEHRHGDKRAGTPEVSERSNRRITIEVGLGRSQIIDMHYLPRSRDPAETAAGIGTDYHASADVCVVRWNVMERASAERLAVIEIEGPEFCITQPYRVRQHCLEYRLQLAGRRADDPQHIGRRGLLLQRLRAARSAGGRSRWR